MWNYTYSTWKGSNFISHSQHVKNSNLEIKNSVQNPTLEKNIGMCGLFLLMVCTGVWSEEFKWGLTRGFMHRWGLSDFPVSCCWSVVQVSWTSAATVKVIYNSHKGGTTADRSPIFYSVTYYWNETFGCEVGLVHTERVREQKTSHENNTSCIFLGGVCVCVCVLY